MQNEFLMNAMNNKEMSAVYRDALGARDYAGIPVIVENEIVVIARENNFSLDGYTALRSGDITEAERMDDVPFLSKIYQGEGIYDSLCPLSFKADSWRSLFSGIMKYYAGWSAVECENPDEPLYFLGRVQSCDERYVTMKLIDATGNWQPDLLTLSLDDITAVGFGDRYLSTFRKYCDK